ncbi:GET complex subunit GET1 [Kluyveromyces lactis]|uniref:Golgi to ER traffic protein 1 n=1 Tax=Kluyveromyces lactis (strain ATCC 8585 / CBS 2359 / DSM 70799 / NBRC 1267 / NRRL Y-1140 / WM37) TaxID=284590 RepID=GET1_KLULA|nr:uncharacterized protein KLLA0_A04796g [Kluyveromyces lactis]Q6CXX9.1 RecName: Full=Golgi to ER traffic protein 1; AltName: Full=Guided entry of tail-anchored proteins 1 [Kluyveromyces lactis NRRL Y-1140]CAH02798.1 KLLA0A04796p [Kluyveromyces lactis]|eukprot:XP_451210.1 uncharacterized protein KLLA0_A04796g [Kluyveromyces lactis]
MESWLLVILAFLVLERLWPLIDSLIQRFAQANSTKLKELMHQRQAILAEQKEISAQDQYVKWTKNNRTLEKINKQIEEEKKQLLSQVDRTKASLKKVKLVLITVPFTILKFYKGKMPIYDLPKGLFPNYLQGLFQHGWVYLALGPLNIKKVGDGTHVTVSLAIWLFALLKVVSTLGNIWESLTAPAIPAPTITTDPIDQTNESEKPPVDQPVD